MKVLFVSHFPIFGGPHNRALRLHPHLAEAGFDLEVVLPDEPGNARARFEAAGVPVHSLPLHRIRNSKSLTLHKQFALGIVPEIRGIQKLIRKTNAGLVVSTGLMNPHAAIAARLSRVPHIWQIVDTIPPKALRAGLAPMVRALSDVVMTTGRLTATAHPGIEGLGDRLIPFYSPVECDAFKPDPSIRDEVRNSWGVTDSDFVFGSVANINPQKGIELLIEAFSIAHASHENSKLVLVGAEYETHRLYSDMLRSMVAERWLEKHVIFLGERTDVARQLQGFDTFVMGSQPRSEGAPTAMMEAMACGLPIISTDVGAVREMVDQGQNGFVLEPLRPDLMANAMRRLMESEPLQKEMAGKAREAALRKFDASICLATHIRAFNMALRLRPPVVSQPELNAA